MQAILITGKPANSCVSMAHAAIIRKSICSSNGRLATVSLCAGKPDTERDAGGGGGPITLLTVMCENRVRTGN